MGKMTYAFCASFKAPSMGMQEVHKYPRCPGKKNLDLQEGARFHNSPLLLSDNKLQQLLETSLKLPYLSLKDKLLKQEETSLP